MQHAEEADDDDDDVLVRVQCNHRKGSSSSWEDAAPIPMQLRIHSLLACLLSNGQPNSTKGVSLTLKQEIPSSRLLNPP